MTPGQKKRFSTENTEAKKRKAKLLERDRKAAGVVRVNAGAQPKKPTAKVAF